MDHNLRKILFIVNKHAGIGYQKQLEGQINDACNKHGAESSIEFTKHRGHAIRLAQDAEKNGFRQVIAVGGDGTLNEVAQGLIHTGIPMGIIPRGSGNGLARHLGIPLNTAAALSNVFDSTVLSMDVVKVNGKLSLNVSGIGFDGHITNLFGVKSSRGLLGYVMLAFQEFLKIREFNAEITAHGETTGCNAFVIAIANSSQYGNNAQIAPAASICDGLLDINIVKKVPFFRFDFVYAFFTGRIGKSSFCKIIKTPSLRVRTDKPVAYHVDGEPCGLRDTFFIECIPGALKILVPGDGVNRRGL